MENMGDKLRQKDVLYFTKIDHSSTNGKKNEVTKINDVVIIIMQTRELTKDEGEHIDYRSTHQSRHVMRKYSFVYFKQFIIFCKRHSDRY